MQPLSPEVERISGLLSHETGQGATGADLRACLTPAETTDSLPSPPAQQLPLDPDFPEAAVRAGEGSGGNQESWSWGQEWTLPRCAVRQVYQQLTVKREKPWEGP